MSSFCYTAPSPSSQDSLRDDLQNLAAFPDLMSKLLHVNYLTASSFSRKLLSSSFILCFIGLLPRARFIQHFLERIKVGNIAEFKFCENKKIFLLFLTGIQSIILGWTNEQIWKSCPGGSCYEKYRKNIFLQTIGPWNTSFLTFERLFNCLQNTTALTKSRHSLL